MKLGTYAAALGSIEQQKRLDVIANNIANVNTPGFKKDSVNFSNFLGEVTYTSMDQGPIRETGNKQDIALFGNGFLKVQTSQGTKYTRAGNLTFNSSKTLVNQEGLPVLGKHGPIRINDPANLRIEEDGQVFDGDNMVDTLDIVQFPSNTVLKKGQNGNFEPAANDTQPTQAQNCTVRQGALEGANFDPVEEMVKMVETSRNFEVYQKTLQTFDRDLDGQIISKLTA
jgi:flagellar basal-body rod protein FlgG